MAKKKLLPSLKEIREAEKVVDGIEHTPPRKMSLKEKVGPLKLPKKRGEPVWRGPEQDGITFSLLSRFLVCRERFRLLVVEGLKPRDQFNHRIEFGNMWHVCEEAHASTDGTNWSRPLLDHARYLCEKYPYNRDEINNWYGIAMTMFPIYVEHWSKHPDVIARKPLLFEQTFSVPYKLPSGRVVRLRGKWDSVDLVDGGIWLMENKTKSDPDVEQIKRQLLFDLQTMLYVVAYTSDSWAGYESEGHFASDEPPHPFKGVRYNVVRRPRQYQGKKETHEEFLKRLEGIVRENPDDFFMRWNVEINQKDVDKFKRECLDPILENLCHWWDGQFGIASRCVPPPSHWRHPFGCYNVLDEGGSSDLDNYLDTGSEVGLQRTNNLFPELTEV